MPDLAIVSHYKQCVFFSSICTLFYSLCAISIPSKLINMMNFLTVIDLSKNTLISPQVPLLKRF